MSRVLVVGAGIAGLSLACALRAAKIPVTVFERDSELKEVGAGLQVWVSGHDALARLGLADAVSDGGLIVDAHELRS